MVSGSNCAETFDLITVIISNSISTKQELLKHLQIFLKIFLKFRANHFGGHTAAIIRVHAFIHLGYST